MDKALKRFISIVRDHRTNPLLGVLNEIAETLSDSDFESLSDEFSAPIRSMFRRFTALKLFRPHFDSIIYAGSAIGSCPTSPELVYKSSVYPLLVSAFGEQLQSFLEKYYSTDEFVRQYIGRIALTSRAEQEWIKSVIYEIPSQSEDDTITRLSVGLSLGLKLDETETNKQQALSSPNRPTQYNTDTIMIPDSSSMSPANLMYSPYQMSPRSNLSPNYNGSPNYSQFGVDEFAMHQMLAQQYCLQIASQQSPQHSENGTMSPNSTYLYSSPQSLQSPFSHGSQQSSPIPAQFTLKIITQPQSKIVKSRYLQPSPVVELVGQAPRNTTVLINASLVLADDVDVILSNTLSGCLFEEINKEQRATFKHLKVNKTTHTLKSLVRLRFSALYAQPVFSKPINIVSHSSLVKKPIEAVLRPDLPPPVMKELVPTQGCVGEKCAIIGTHLYHTYDLPLMVLFGEVPALDVYMHCSGTLICTIPENVTQTVVVRIERNLLKTEGIPFTYI